MPTAHTPPFLTIEEIAAKAKADARAKDHPAESVYTVTVEELHTLAIPAKIMRKALKLYGFHLPEDASPIMDGDSVAWEWFVKRQEVR